MPNQEDEEEEDKEEEGEEAKRQEEQEGYEPEAEGCRVVTPPWWAGDAWWEPEDDFLKEALRCMPEHIREGKIREHQWKRKGKGRDQERAKIKGKGPKREFVSRRKVR